MFEDIKQVHLIGAGGIGISAIGKWFLKRGVPVSGSDKTPSQITRQLEELGAIIFYGHSAEQISADCDLVVFTEAAPEDNPERQEATRRGITQLSHFDFLGALSKTMRTICVTGTNGKSTTTAMVGKIFEEAGMDPTVFVGSLLPGWELGNLRMGKSDLLIVEGDEYKQKMVKLFPETTVITNIEEDHLDVYRDLNHIVETFQQLVTQTAGKVFLNRQDVNSASLMDGQIEYYGVEETLGFALQIPGQFNEMNAMAAQAVARSYGISDEIITKALKDFSGIWRRFERVGSYNGADVISDYGHHPTAIRVTIQGAKTSYPGRRIVLCYEPHQHNRTKELFEDFVLAFDGVDVLILPEIYEVAGRTEDTHVSSKDLADRIRERKTIPEVRYATDHAEAKKEIAELVKPGDLLIIMGAGNIDDVARELVR